MRRDRRAGAVSRSAMRRPAEDGEQLPAPKRVIGAPKSTLEPVMGAPEQKVAPQTFLATGRRHAKAGVAVAFVTISLLRDQSPFRFASLCGTRWFYPGAIGGRLASRFAGSFMSDAFNRLKRHYEPAGRDAAASRQQVLNPTPCQPVSTLRRYEDEAR